MNSVSDSTIPSKVINEITRRADRDNNGVLDFEEFMDLIQSHELGVLQPRLHSILRAAAFTVVPQKERAAVIRSGLEEYKCCPPPLLMPILSLVEVNQSDLSFTNQSITFLIILILDWCFHLLCNRNGRSWS